VPIFLVRHGETEWSLSGQHTSSTDLPLTEKGRERAAGLGPVLAAWDFALVLTSPLRRARETCEIAGYADRAEICEDLREWDYGEYEGLTTPQIREDRPDWNLWRDGCPGG
jgi:probable phosphoglycerate mutase